VKSTGYEAVVVGAGPNGLAAAITLTKHGLKTIILERNNIIGGSAASSELTLPQFIHDNGAAIHPTGTGSPFFQSLPLSRFGLEWINPPAALAHPFDDGTAAILETSIEATAETLGTDAASYCELVKPFVDQWERLLPDLLGTKRSLHHPIVMAKFGMKSLSSARGFADRFFTGTRAKGFFAGLAAHSILRPDRVPSAAFGFIFCLAGHAIGWPIPKGGAISISNALADYFKSLDGTIITDKFVAYLSDLPDSRAFFFDTSPATLVKLYGDKLPRSYRKKLLNYQYGPGSFKIDWALSAPIPWTARECLRAGTVHLGGKYSEIAEAEQAAWNGKIAEKPFVILAQPSLFDTSRAPAGKHTAWAYCHVPHGSCADMTSHIENQIERFAPGFRDIILARHVSTPESLEADNPNLVGGDIVGGAQTLRQMICRPTCSRIPYATPLKGVYLCSASTPPGAGVHGMCGFHAAQAYLRAIKS
jgi:phytoene dehydrogenase-like protein